MAETKLCLDKLQGTDLRGLDLSVVFAVNGADDELLQYIEGVTCLRLPGVPNGAHADRHLMLTNPGKGASVNEVVRKELAKGGALPSFILSMDSDLVSHNPKWLHNLLDGYYRASRMRRIGAVVSDQTVNCCHVPLNPISVGMGEMEIVFAEGNNGIAGGCLLTPLSVWLELGGYKAHRVYGSDDGHYMQSLHEAGYKSCIVKSCSLAHPHPRDVAYQDWKVRACRDQLADSETRGYFESTGT